MRNVSVSESDHVVIFDYSSLAYQAFYSNYTGRESRFLNIVLSSLKDVLRDGELFSIVFAIDSTPIRKLKIDPKYKANRARSSEEDPKEILKETLDLVKSVHLSSFGEEADDVIYSLIKGIKNKKVTIISRDWDLTALISKSVHFFDPYEKKVRGAMDVINKFGVPPSALPTFKAVCGDRGDNVPPIAPRILKKEAIPLILKKDPDFTSVKSIASAGEAAMDRFKTNMQLTGFTTVKYEHKKADPGTEEFQKIKEICPDVLPFKRMLGYE